MNAALDCALEAVNIQLTDFASGEEKAGHLLTDLDQLAEIAEFADGNLSGLRDGIASLPRLTSQLNLAKRSMLSALDTYSNLVKDLRLRVEGVRARLLVGQSN